MIDYGTLWNTLEIPAWQWERSNHSGILHLFKSLRYRQDLQVWWCSSMEQVSAVPVSLLLCPCLNAASGVPGDEVMKTSLLFVFPLWVVVVVVAASPVPAHSGSIVYSFWKLKILEGTVLFNNMILYNKLFLNLY